MKVKDNTIQIMAHCLRTKTLMEVKLHCWLAGMPARPNLKYSFGLSAQGAFRRRLGCHCIKCNFTGQENVDDLACLEPSCLSPGLCFHFWTLFPGSAVARGPKLQEPQVHAHTHTRTLCWMTRNDMFRTLQIIDDRARIAGPVLWIKSGLFLCSTCMDVICMMTEFCKW